MYGPKIKQKNTKLNSDIFMVYCDYIIVMHINFGLGPEISDEPNFNAV